VFLPLDDARPDAFTAPVNPPSALRCVAALAATVCCFCSIATRAEAQGDPPVPTPAPVVEPAPPQPTFVPLEEVGARAELAKQAIQNRMAQVKQLGQLDEPRAAGKELTQRVTEQSERLVEQLDRVVALDRLLELDAQWLALGAELDVLLEALSTRLRGLDDQLGQLTRSQELWQETVNEAQRKDAPANVRTLAAQVRNLAREASDQVQTIRSNIVELRTQLGAETAQISQARERIATTRAELLSKIFVRDQPPIWSMGSSREGMTAVAERVRAEFVRQVDATRKLAMEQKERGSLQLLLLLVLIVLGRRARDRARRLEAEDTRARHLAVVFDHPLAIALLISIVATRWIYDQPPRAVQELADLLLLFPALVLIAPLLERALRPALLCLAGFYILDQLRDVVDPLPVVSRTLFTFEMLLGLGTGAWFWWHLPRELAPPSDETSPANGHPPSAPGDPAISNGHGHANGNGNGMVALARDRFSTLRAWFPTLLQWGTLALGFAAVCSILGFQRLARLIGDSLLESAYVGILFYALLQSVQAFITMALRTRWVRPIHTLSDHVDTIERFLARALQTGSLLGWGLITLGLFGLWDPLLSAIGTILSSEIGVGSIRLSLGSLLLFGVTIAAALTTAKLIEVILNADVYPRLEVARGSAYAFSTILRYLLILAGFTTAMSALGFDTDRLTVLVGAFGVGVGFGLQTVVNNFVSGLILLFERPIQVGDAIEVDTVSGVVRHIGIRASVVRTWDGSEVSVPNGNLLSQNLTNWTMSDRHRRIEIPVGVAYGSDPAQVLELLRGVASGHAQILREPKPQALFVGFGASSLDFSVRAWVLEHDLWTAIRSELVSQIHRALYDNGIEIPFPQQDIHLRSLPAAGPAPTTESPVEPA